MKLIVKNGKKLCLYTRQLLLLVLAIFIVCSTAESGVASEKPEGLRMMFLPNKSEMEIVKTFAPFVKVLENELNMKIEVFSGKDYKYIIDKLRTHETDIAMLGGFAYINAQDDFGVKLFVRNLEAEPDGKIKDSYQSIIITRKDSNINSIQDLKGKRFAFTDRNSTSGFLFPLVGLMNNKIDLDDLSSVIYVNKHANSLFAVFNNQVDAGALSDGSYARAVGVDLSQIKILWKSDPIHYGAWVARNDMSDQKVELIKTAFLKISQRNDARQIFSNAYIKGFVPAIDADYDNVRQVLKLQAAMEKQ